MNNNSTDIDISFSTNFPDFSLENNSPAHSQSTQNTVTSLTIFDENICDESNQKISFPVSENNRRHRENYPVQIVNLHRNRNPGEKFFILIVTNNFKKFCLDHLCNELELLNRLCILIHAKAKFNRKLIITLFHVTQEEACDLSEDGLRLVRLKKRAYNLVMKFLEDEEIYSNYIRTSKARIDTKSFLIVNRIEILKVFRDTTHKPKFMK